MTSTANSGWQGDPARLAKITEEELQVSDLKAKIMEQAEHAFASAKAAKNVDGMTRATEMLLRIWLEESSRYAQVPAAPGKCSCGAE